jgi:putative ABC transport system permease protein
MSFLKFFWKDFTSDQSYNGFTILCASLGIVGLLLVESFKVGVEEKVAKNAKNFIASDLSISSRRQFLDNEKTLIDEYTKNHQIKTAQWIETYSLVMPIKKNEAQAKLADLNFVSSEFPFYGSVTLESEGLVGPKHVSWKRLHNNFVVWIARDFAWQLGLAKGDSLKIGEATFVVDAIILEDKFSSFRGFNLAPKIFLSTQNLMSTGLIQFGSTATFTYALKLPSDQFLKDIQKDLLKKIPDRTIKILTPLESGQQISRSLDILGNYLSLITLMTYLLSLIGLYYFTQHYLSLKLKTFSIYKALGLKTSFLFKLSFTHLIVLTFLSVVFSSTFVKIVLPFLQSYFSHLAGENLLFILNPKSLMRILSLSLIGSLLALGPLFFGALQTPVAQIFQDLPTELKRIKYYFYFPLFFYILFLSFFLAKSFKVAGLFILALLAIIFLGALSFKLVTFFLEKISRFLQFINRHAVKALSRYFTSSFTIFICLLIGMTLSTFIIQLEHSLKDELTQNFGEKKPDLFLFDLQDSQALEFNKLKTLNKWNQTMFAPMIRGRLITINNQSTREDNEVAETQFTNRDDEETKRFKNRGVNLSYREKLSWSESVVEGVFNGKKCQPELKPCEISLERNYAKRMGIKLSDTLVFDVSGSRIEGVVTSLRSVKWTSFEPNFFILFGPGVLEEAPKTYLVSLKVKTLTEKRQIFAKMAQFFPNVSILEVREILHKITSLFDLMAQSINMIANLSLFVALIVLIAVTFNHLDLRKKEMSLFFILGLTHKQIAQIFTREFLFLVILSFLLSAVLGSLLTHLMMKFIFDSNAIFNLPLVLGTTFFLSFILVVIIHLKILQQLKRSSSKEILQ